MNQNDNLSHSTSIPCHSVLGVGVAIFRNGRYLLGLRRSQYGLNSWGFPGGKIEEAEDPVAACARELREETGLILKTARPVGWNVGWMQYAQIRHITLFVEADADGEPELAEPDKFFRWAWFSRHELPENLFSPTRAYFDEFEQDRVLSSEPTP